MKSKARFTLPPSNSVSRGSPILRIIANIVRFSVDHNRSVITTVTLLLLAATFQLPRLRIDWNTAHLVPQSSNLESQLLDAPDTDSVVIALETDRGVFTREAFSELQRVEDELLQIPGIDAKSVLSLRKLRIPSFNDDRIDLRPFSERYDQSDPLQLESLKSFCLQLGLNQTSLLSADGTVATVFARFHSLARQNEAIADLSRLVERGPQMVSGALHLGGSAVAQIELGRWSVVDISRLLPCIALALWLLLAFFCRSVFVPTIVLLEVGISLVLSLGFLASCGTVMYVTALIVPVLVIVVGAADDMYVLARILRSERVAGTIPKDYLVRAALDAGPSVLMATGINALSFSTLFVTHIVPLHALAFFGLLGSTISCIFTFTLVPALLSTFKHREVNSRPLLPELRFGAMIQAIRNRYSQGARDRTVGGLYCSVGVLLLLSSRYLFVNDSWTGGLPTNSRTALDAKWFDEKLHGSTAINFGVDTLQTAGALQASTFQKLLRIEDSLLADTPDATAYSFARELVRTLAVFNHVSFTGYLNAIRSSSIVLSGQDLTDAHKALEFGGRNRPPLLSDSQQRHVGITIFAKNADFVKMHALWKRMVAINEQEAKSTPNLRVYPIGDLWTAYRAISGLVGGLLMASVLSFAACLAVLTICFNSFRQSLVVLLPVAISLSLILAIMALLKIPVGIANSMFISVAFGLGLDYAIHVRNSLMSKEPEAFHKALYALSICACSVIPALVVLQLSALRPIRELGALIGGSLLVSYACVIILIPTLLNQCAQDFTRQRP